MSSKHKGTLGFWARENGHRKWDELYHPENVKRRQQEGIKFYNRRHKIGDHKRG